MDSTETDVFHSVEWPVVMLDGHDVGLFEESGDLQALEPWMAYDKGPEFYDARGRRLRAFVALYGVDVMVCADPSASDTDRVLEIVKGYLNEMEQNPHIPVAALRRFMASLEATRP